MRHSSDSTGKYVLSKKKLCEILDVARKNELENAKTRLTSMLESCHDAKPGIRTLCSGTKVSPRNPGIRTLCPGTKISPQNPFVRVFNAMHDYFQ